MKGKSRQRQLTLARQVAMYVARKHLGASLPEIGRAFGGRDHTTVLSSVRKVSGLLASDAGMQAVIGRIERALGGDL
jgi:chromosomal replication initiator protein